MKKKVNYVLDADIQSFFDNLDKAWVIRFIEHRVAVVAPVDELDIILDAFRSYR